jgi:enoyl-[acyl-carrier protein] reductase I
MFNFQKRHSPLRRSLSLEDVSGPALYLLSDLSAAVTGEIHFVDAGYHIVALPHPDVLKAQEELEARAAAQNKAAE